MYDTSDIRKGLKVLIDGNPYTIVEFQFVKPGKGTAFQVTLPALRMPEAAER